MKRLVQWILSKLFPYNTPDIVSKNNAEWSILKSLEQEEFYFGRGAIGKPRKTTEGDTCRVGAVRNC
jgi:hypothetical protein